jgi:DNA-binding GntR family transcriptional regulator
MPTLEEAADLYELRGPIEALAGRCFVRHACTEQLRALRDAQERLAHLPVTERLDMREVLAAQDDFYAALLAGVTNQALRTTLAGVHARVRILRAAALGSRERVAAMVRETAAILAAAEARDEDAITRACTEHVVEAGARALSARAATVG